MHLPTWTPSAPVSSLQECPKGGCQGICNSPSCFQLCDSGNCSFECNGPHCRQNCSAGGCTLTCPIDAESCVQYCAAQNCSIIRVTRTTASEDGHVLVQSSAGDQGIHFNRIKMKTSSGSYSFLFPCSFNCMSAVTLYAVGITLAYWLSFVLA